MKLRAGDAIRVGAPLAVVVQHVAQQVFLHPDLGFALRLLDGWEHANSQS